jgi:short-subunit dehydrogenase
MDKKIILITGASNGLGLSIARRLMNKNYLLILTARAESLHRFESEKVYESDSIWVRPLDVMSSTDRNLLFKEINEKLGGIDVLINNAGFTFRSVLEHVEQDELLQQMITNFWGPMELVRSALPKMREKRRGNIINISSVGGMMAMPTMSVYSASKFALEGASEALYYEVRPWNIFVSLIEPGFINSESFKAVRYTTLSGQSMRTPSEAYYGHYRFMTEFIEKLMARSFTKPDDIAKKIEQVILSKHPPLRIPVTIDAYFFDLLRRFLPRRLYHWILYRALPFPDCWGDTNRLAARCAAQRKRVTSKTEP